MARRPSMRRSQRAGNAARRCCRSRRWSRRRTYGDPRVNGCRRTDRRPRFVFGVVWLWCMVVARDSGRTALVAGRARGTFDVSEYGREKKEIRNPRKAFASAV
eukprot:3816308-Prymnesium_polylepis.1